MLNFPTFWLWKTDYICIFLKALSHWAWADFPASFFRWYLTCFWTCYCYWLSRINPSTQQFALKYYLIIHCTSERQPCPCDICGVSSTYLFNFILRFILVSVSVPWVLAYSQPVWQERWRPSPFSARHRWNDIWIPCQMWVQSPLMRCCQEWSLLFQLPVQRGFWWLTHFAVLR